MVLIETFLNMANYLSPREDDDLSDRLNYLITPNLLLAFTVLISYKQFGGKPIECMFTDKFPASWEQYAENYCWSQNTYFVEPRQDVSLLKEEERYERHLSYYQWLPFFLLIQTAFFRAPSYLWKLFSNNSGIRILDVVRKAKDESNLEEGVRERNIGILKEHLSRALRFQANMEAKRVNKTVTFINPQYSSGFMSWVYLITKCLYLVNVLAQLWLINHFLGTNRYEWYGFGVVKDIVSGVPWQRSGYFPRAAVCDFEIRQVANIQKHSVQCVLVVNVFNEKIFVLLWFWYLILLFASTISFVKWFTVLVLPCFSKRFIKQHLALSTLQNFTQRNNKREDADVEKFVTQYLHKDVVFVLRMVSSHAGIIFATDLVQALYEAYDFQNKIKGLTGSPVSDDLQTISTGADSLVDGAESSVIRERTRRTAGTSTSRKVSSQRL